MQHHCVVLAREVGVEVEGVAVQDSSLAHLVSELHVHGLQVVQRAALEVKLFAEGLRGQVLLWVVSVQNWLLELLDHGFLV